MTRLFVARVLNGHRGLKLGFALTGLMCGGLAVATFLSTPPTWFAQVYGTSVSIPTVSKDARANSRSTIPRTHRYGESDPRLLLSFAAPLLVINAPTNLNVYEVSSGRIRLSWDPVAGVNHYQVESGPSLTGTFTTIGYPVTNSFDDWNVTSVHSYLYRVRAVDGLGVVSSPSNLALGTAIDFTDAALAAGATVIKKQHFYDLRLAVNAVRVMAGVGEFAWTDSDLTGLEVKAVHVQQLRDKLDQGLLALNIPLTVYEDPSLVTGLNGTLIRKMHVEQLRERSTRGKSTSSGPADSGGADSSTPRLDPANRTGGGGEDPLSRNFNWSVPLVGLPGRSGLDLGLSLSYNSLVWTKNGSTISFDDDRGFPSPGFRLGFPVIQSSYFNSEVGKNAYLLITPNGERVELRQVGSSSLYEAADSSHLLLDSSTSPMILRTTDGTQLSYEAIGGEYQCTRIKDRNGNFITINYTAFGRIDTVIDTLSRTIKFNYDGGNYLSSITQTWNGQQHTWATFTYNSNLAIQTSFSGVTNVGPQNGSILKVLTQVTLDDGSRFNFDYTSWGQIWKISNYAADAHLLNYRSYNLPLDNSTAQTDCPRLTERHDWAENWNRSGPAGPSLLPSGAEQEVVTSYAVPVTTSWTLPDGTPQTGTLAQVTSTDGTSNKIYFAGTAGTSSGWQRGLPSMVETYSGSTRQRQSVTTWTQDNTAVSYILNPRPSETNVYDPAGNRARTRVTYQAVSLADSTTCNLPQDVYEYQANATTVLRRTHTDYDLGTTYTSRRIIGLASDRTLYEVDPNTQVETLMSKVGFQYDETGSVQNNDAPAQHDNTNYTSSFVGGRANLSSVKRYDVTNTSQFVVSSMKYNTAGATVAHIDPLNHQVLISYADSFSDGINSRNTLAYPTTITDPHGYSSTSKYNFDFGAVTRIQSPPPQNQTVGAIKNLTYDSLARIQKVAVEFNGNAEYNYQRFEYPTSQNRVDTYATLESGQGEAHSFKITDGHGRVIAAASDHPGSTGGFSGQLVLFDAMGRGIKTSNPAETSASGTPSQWAVAGDDAATSWLYTAQTFDWKGRPLVKTNTDGTTKEATYAGCGCAGGQVVTLTDEGTLVNGSIQKRQQKIYSDVLGRPWKTELLNWQGGSIYSTSITSYNARDQVTLVSQYQGAESSGVHQDTTMSYDGYGRLKTQHAPEQQIDTNNPASTDHTTWDYNPDDTIEKVTDARGAVSNFTYNNRRLVTGISYTFLAGVPTTGNSAVPATATVGFAYDAAGNRTSMTDGMGSMSYQYDQLSRLTSETRQFTDPVTPFLNGSFTLSYTYNLAGEVASVTDPTGVAVNYGYDKTGRLSGVSGTQFAGVSEYAIGMEYRAFNGLKSLTYGTQPTSGSNTSRTQTYDVRQQLATLQVGSALSAEFEYHADGQIKYAKDNTEAVKDRAYNYDQVGRLAEGLSGAEARNPTAAADGVYRQSYQYDAWSNLTGRAVNRFWSGGEAFGTSYVNNREAGGIYDAEGNVVRDVSNRTHVYDAVGRQTRTSETSQSSSWGAGVGMQSASPSMSPSASTGDESGQPDMPEGGYYTTTVLTIVQGYDGDGQSLKRVQTKTQSKPGYVPWTTERVEYYVRSSVLGGKVITEFDSQGLKLKTHVYAGGVEVAEQNGHEVQSVTWTYSNPVTGTTAEQTIYGYNKKEYDPFGLELGTNDPYVQHAEPDYPALAGGSSYLNGGNPFGRNTGCAWDGAPIRCDILFGVVFRHSKVTGDTSDIAGLHWIDTTDRSKVKSRLTELDEKGNPIGAPGDWSTPPAQKMSGHWETWMMGLLPQQPEGDTAQVTTADDLKNLLKEFYKKYQKKLARCAWSVFATDKDGLASNVAQIMPRQTLRNAPVNSIVLGYSSGQIGGQGMTDGRTGLIYIASLLRGTPLDNGRQVSAQEQYLRVYAHELGNHISWLYTGNGRSFGTNGIQGQAVPFGIPSIHVDNDTGARLEKCIFGDVSF